jgi:ribosomal protein S18 acetylase RimI-like enzyme
MVYIREAEPDDAAAIARVHVDTWRTTYAGIVPADHLARLSPEKGEENWRGQLTTPPEGRFVYVAVDEREGVVGFAAAGPCTADNPVCQGEIYAIYLLAGHQCLGIGRVLVRAVAGRLIRQGISSMLVWVLADNPTRGFYQALGGQLVGEKSMVIGGAELVGVAYGWPDIQHLADLTP